MSDGALANGRLPRGGPALTGAGIPGDAAPSFAAVDLGATSGRVIVGTVSKGRVELTEVGRFANEPILVPPIAGAGTPVLTWDLPALWGGILAGLREAHARCGPLSGIGIDSWAVDYGRIDSGDSLLGNPVCYRDARTEAVLAAAFERVSAERQYAINGLQVQPFTTAFQLLAEPSLEATERIVLLPDLIGAWLTGQVRAEITNASTTGLFDARTRTWSLELATEWGLPTRLLPPSSSPVSGWARFGRRSLPSSGLPAWRPARQRCRCGRWGPTTPLPPSWRYR